MMRSSRLLLVAFVAAACNSQPELGSGEQSITAVIDASPAMSSADGGDCFDPSCWTYPWGDFEPEFTAVADAGVGPMDTGAYDAVRADAGYVDAGYIDARYVDATIPADAAPADAPVDAGCVAQKEPDCPQPPPGEFQPQNPGIPGGGQCRGACGKACPPTCRAGTPTTTCLEWRTADCQWHAKVCTYPVLECGSAAGCRWHDACYDTCPTATFPAICRRECDAGCIRRYGAKTCNAWRQGNGPYDSWLSYTGTPTSYTYDSTCY